MPGPSRKVQGGYLGYSALGDAYDKAFNQVRGAQTERLEQEKLELQNEQAVDNLFSLPGQQQVAGGSKGRRQPKTTVVTNNGFSFISNPDDIIQQDMLTPSLGLNKTPEEMEYDNYKQDVVSKQKEVFAGQDFSLDGSSLPQGGTFNSTLQNALEQLKGAYVKEGRRTSPKKRRAGRNMVRQQLGALQAFAGEIQGMQQAYIDAYKNDLISYGTKSEYIDFLNTLQVPNDLQIAFKDGRGALVGTSASGMPINLPLDNISAMRNGLVLKSENPQPTMDKLLKEVSKVVKSVDENGFEYETNEWTEDKANYVMNVLGSKIQDKNQVLSTGIDWLGFDPSKFKKMIQENPEEARQAVLSGLTNSLSKSYNQTSNKGALTPNEALAQERFEEQKRATKVRENQAQQRIDKGLKPDEEAPSQEEALYLQNLTEELSFIKPGAGDKQVILSGLVGGKVKKASYKPSTKDFKDQFPDGYYEVEVQGGGKNLIDVNDKRLLFEYIANANGITPELVRTYADSLGQSNNTQSNKAEALRKKYKY